jgi:hypothetical protein
VIVLARGAADEGLAAMAPGSAVRALLPHCFAPHLAAARLVEALAAMARRVPVARLDFADSTRAADLLADSHG